jgi:hypothetical protein
VFGPGYVSIVSQLETEEVGLSKGGLVDRTLDDDASCGKHGGLLGRFWADVGL